MKTKYRIIAYVVIMLIFLVKLVFSTEATEKSNEWIVHYKFNNIQFVFIVDGKNITDNWWDESLVINDSISLLRGSILYYNNKYAYGKQVKTSPNNAHQDLYGEHMKLYNLKKRILLESVPCSRIIEYK